MSVLALGIDIAVSLIGGLIGRRTIGRVLTKATEKALGPFGKKEMVKDTAMVVGEGIGATIASDIKNKITGDEEKTFSKELATNLAGLGIASAGLYGAKITYKGVKPLAEKITPKLKLNRVIDNFFFHGAGKEERELISKHFNKAFIVGQMFEPVRKTIDDVLNASEYKTFRQEVINQILSKRSDIKPILETWDKLYSRADNPIDIITLEYMFLQHHDKPFVKEVIGRLKSLPFWEEKVKAFKSNKEWILRRFFNEEIKSGKLPKDFDVEGVIKRIIDNTPDHVIAGYIPRYHFSIPIKATHKVEIEPEDIINMTFDDVIDLYAVQTGALKVREYPTLLSKFLAYLDNIHAIDELRNVGYKRGSDLYKSYMSGYTTPIILNSLPNLLKELAEKNFALINSKIVPPEFSPKVFTDWKGNQFIVKESSYNIIKQMMDYFSGIMPIYNPNPLTAFTMKLKHISLSLSLFHASTLTKARVVLDTEDLNDLGAIFSRTMYAIMRKGDLESYVKDLEWVSNSLLELHEKTGQPIKFTLGMEELAYERWKVLTKWLANHYEKYIDNEGVRQLFNLLSPIEKGVSKVFGSFDKFMWDIVYKTYKLAVAKEVLTKWKAGQIADDEAVKSLESINHVFGGAYEWLYVSPKTNELLRLLLFAPDWYLSLWRNMTTWLNDDSYLVASFFPAIARLHLLMTIGAYNYAGLDYMDYLTNIMQHLASHYTHADSPLDLATEVGKTPLLALYYSTEAFKLRIPVMNKAGQMKILEFDPIKIEYEPLEMIGLIGLAKAMAENKDLPTAINEAGGEAIRYWNTKLSSVLRMITNMASERFRDPTLDNYLSIIADAVFPLTFTFAGKQLQRYYTNEELEPIMALSFMLRNFAVGSRVSRNMADSLSMLILGGSYKYNKEQIEFILDNAKEIYYSKLGLALKPKRLSMVEKSFYNMMANQLALVFINRYKLTELEGEEFEKALSNAISELQRVDLGKYNFLKDYVRRKIYTIYNQKLYRERIKEFVEEE